MIYIRKIYVILIILFSLSTALGDVRISHRYVTEGGEVNDDVYLHNVDYANSVSIYQDSLFAAANSILNDGDEVAIFRNRVVTRGESKRFGTSIEAGAQKKFNHHMDLATGHYAKDRTSISYNLESGDVASNYFTDEGSVSEGVKVNNVNYANRANIYPQSLYCSAKADLLGDIGSLADAIFINSNDGVFGTNLAMFAKERLSLDKEFVAGRLADPKSDISYSFELGTTKASYFNPLVDVDEFILTDSCMYQGSIKNSAEELQSKGYGKATEADSGMFIYGVNMSYNGLPTEISASLTTGSEAYGSNLNAPVNYVWNTLVESNGNYAKSAVSAKGYNGNRDVDLEIMGRSEGLTDKIAGPMRISPIGFIGISKGLYMSYEITR